MVPDFEGRGRAHLKGAQGERLQISLAFPGIPSETSRVSETPLLELLCEEDPELYGTTTARSTDLGCDNTCRVVMDLASSIDFVSALD